MQEKPRLMAVSVISALVLLTVMTFEVIHLLGRISTLEIAVAGAHQIGEAASAEVEELRVNIEELQDEVADLKSQRQSL